MVSRTASVARTAYLVLAWLFVAAILYQVFLVGLALLAGQTTWGAHVDLGHTIGVLPLLLVILSFVGRLPSSEKWLAGLLVGVYIVQAEVFAVIRSQAPFVAAFHPVLALVLFAIAVVVAQHARDLVRQPEEKAAPAQRSAQPDIAQGGVVQPDIAGSDTAGPDIVIVEPQESDITRSPRHDG